MNADGSDTWPEGKTIDVQLTADGTAVSGKTATLSASQKSYKFTGLAKYQADGTTEIKYSVKEGSVAGYDSAVGEVKDGKVTITNTQKTIEIEVEKVWNDETGKTMTWPEGMTVDIQLTADGTAVSGKTATLSASQKSYKFTKLPKYQADGTTEIKYSVKEVKVPEYTTVVGELTEVKDDDGNVTGYKITVTNKCIRRDLVIKKALPIYVDHGAAKSAASFVFEVKGWSEVDEQGNPVGKPILNTTAGIDMDGSGNGDTTLGKISAQIVYLEVTEVYAGNYTPSPKVRKIKVDKTTLQGDDPNNQYVEVSFKNTPDNVDFKTGITNKFEKTPAATPAQEGDSQGGQGND